MVCQALEPQVAKRLHILAMRSRITQSFTNRIKFDNKIVTLWYAKL